MDDLAAFSGMVVLEAFLVAHFVSNDGFDLVFDSTDLNGLGWVFHHYVRPSRHGYRPIGYALTTFQQNNLGIGYIGTISDIRHSEKGELLSLSLLNPDRFLFELAPAVPAKHPWGEPAKKPEFRTFGREAIGGVVALDGKVVANLLVKTVDRAVLDDIEGEAVEEVDEVEGDDAVDTPIETADPQAGAE